MADKKIDPRLYAPLVAGYEYEDDSETTFVEDNVAVLDVPVTSPGLQPPDTVTIIEQIFRKGADGRTVVDLVIEVEDVPGAQTYEVRTSTV